MGIEVRGVTKRFGGGFKALDQISLSVKEGELLALLGPSGSGKTTLLRVIGGIELPDEGEVFFHGQNAQGMQTASRRVGFVFQHYALFKHMTVFDNVGFGLTVRPRHLRPSREEIRERVFKLLNLVQLDRMANRYPSELSGGQRQRIALARALAIEPKVLLLDEPFGALDAKVRRDLRQWLRNLHDAIHITSIFVTHDQEEALEVADRIAVLNEGRIIQVGTPEEVYHHPADAFVYNFLGNVNLFHGRVDGSQVFLGDQQAELKANGGADHKAVYVRPHAMDLHRESPKAGSLSAVVEFINVAGPLVKVELRHDDGEMVRVEIPHERYQTLQLKRGDRVFISLKDMKIFTEDYSI